MPLPTPTQSMQPHPWCAATHLYPQNVSTNLHSSHPSTRLHPRLPRTHARTNSSDLKSLIDEHIAWQDNAIRPGTRGTLLVDWDGSGEPLLSYRSGRVFASLVGGEGGAGVVDGVDREDEEDEDGGFEEKEGSLLEYPGEDEDGGGILGLEEEERGVREVLEEMLETMVRREGVMEGKGKDVFEEEEKGKEIVGEQEKKGKGEVQVGFLIRRKPVPVRQSGPVQQSVIVQQSGDEGKKDVGVNVSVDKAVPEAGKVLREVPAEEQVERFPLFYRYEEVPREREEVKRKQNRRSVGRLAEVLKEEGLEVWGMLKYEGKELMAVLKYEGKGLLEEVKEDGKELLVGWKEEGRWLSVVLRNEWRDGRMFVGRGIKKVVKIFFGV
ncbi:hypothetical protein COCVIDRAFT_11432 [Bipolaris victoriae FI3]|uniref:Uncharacterized protein n=1 Tax=Bipolaris victoriae (strain FI3) TaxID=930091 RepID=W7EQC0_BIPV3|nr:hypothetical protein COCVIDRAFT_11432 [Bipolaris victoriae FI3]